MHSSLQIHAEPQPQIQGQTKICNESIEKYEAAVKGIQTLAILACIRVKAMSFFGLCVLTWGTSVLLGGIVTNLSPKQFLAFAGFLMAQAVQFGASVSWRGFLPDASLIIRHSWPLSIRERTIKAMRCIIFGFSELLHSVIVMVAIICIPVYPSTPNVDVSTLGNADKLTILSIYIFYALASANAIFTSFGFMILAELVRSETFPCVQKYYDRLVWVGWTQGLRRLKQLEVVDVVFEMMSQEFRNGTCNPEEVFIVYEKMIKCAYRHDRGLEAALAAMESSDRYVQEAAVHMVGFWADHHEQGASQKKLRFEKALLRKLVELCTNSGGLIGSKAARSIEMLARADPQGMLNAGESSQVLVQMLVKHVVELVDLLRQDPQLNERTHDSIPHIYESLLYICKALTRLLICDQDCFCKCITIEQCSRLSERLLGIFQSCHPSWKQVQVVVGYALQLVGCTSLTEEIVFRHLKAETAAPRSSFVLFDDEEAWFTALVERDARPLGWESNTFLKVSSRDEIYRSVRKTLLLDKYPRSNMYTFFYVFFWILAALLVVLLLGYVSIIVLPDMSFIIKALN